MVISRLAYAVFLLMSDIFMTMFMHCVPEGKWLVKLEYEQSQEKLK